ncbi:MAG: double zinc ribbon domain-containing protein [Sphingomicrobium sp.]
MKQIKSIGGKLLDFVLPPRCAACGTIVGDLDSFCADCWLKVDFLGNSGCHTCGRPLEATEASECAVCLAAPPILARTRAAVAYGEIARSIAIRGARSRWRGRWRAIWRRWPAKLAMARRRQF